MNRNLSTILDQLRSSNFCKTKINEIKLLIENYYIDVKKNDAYLLLNTLGKIKSPISIKTKSQNS